MATREVFDHHGMPGYRRGCRCAVCRGANTEKMKADRIRRQGYPPEKIPHGVYGYSNYKCRCDVCTEAWMEDMRQRTQSRRGRSDTPHGTASGFHFWGCRCESCRKAAFKSGNTRSRRSNQRTRESATRYYLQWTGPELELAARTDLTSVQVAQMIGRTRYAVEKKRRRLREPMSSFVAGVSQRDASRG